MKNFISHEGQLANNMPYTLVGRGKNGPAEQIDDTVFRIGEDTALIIPEQNIIGVFDGVSERRHQSDDPSLASKAAAFAIRDYARRAPEVDLLEGLEYGRRAVKATTPSMKTSALLVRINDTAIETATAGDSFAATYNTHTMRMTPLNEQQARGNDLFNFLGNHRYERAPDEHTILERTADQHELHVMSDGVSGHSRSLWGELDDNHFQDAHDQTLQFFLHSYTTDTGFAEMTKEYLRDFWNLEANQQAFENEMAEYETAMDVPAELADPSKFDPYAMHPYTWETVLEPMLKQTIIKTPIELGQKAIATALLRRPIAWPQEREQLNDDASLVMVDLSALS